MVALYIPAVALDILVDSLMGYRPTSCSKEDLRNGSFLASVKKLRTYFEIHPNQAHPGKLFEEFAFHLLQTVALAHPNFKLSDIARMARDQTVFNSWSESPEVLDVDIFPSAWLNKSLLRKPTVSFEAIAKPCCFYPKEKYNNTGDSFFVFQQSQSIPPFALVSVQNKLRATSTEDLVHEWRTKQQYLTKEVVTTDKGYECQNPLFVSAQPRKSKKHFDNLFSVYHLLITANPISPSTVLNDNEAAMDFTSMREWCPTASENVMAAVTLQQLDILTDFE